jgi:DNA end-binding protein Ku
MEVLEFVASDEIDPLLFESSYYTAPEEKVSKPYALSMAALKATKRDAVAKIAMHNREHVVLIRVSEGGLVLHTLGGHPKPAIGGHLKSGQRDSGTRH